MCGTGKCVKHKRPVSYRSHVVYPKNGRLADQIEFAYVILLNKLDAVPPEIVDKAEKLDQGHNL
jgi:G3E family GTPase